MLQNTEADYVPDVIIEGDVITTAIGKASVRHFDGATALMSALVKSQGFAIMPSETGDARESVKDLMDLYRNLARELKDALNAKDDGEMLAMAYHSLLLSAGAIRSMFEDIADGVAEWTLEHKNG